MAVPGRNQDEVWRRVPEMLWKRINVCCDGKAVNLFGKKEQLLFGTMKIKNKILKNRGDTVAFSFILFDF